MFLRFLRWLIDKIGIKTMIGFALLLIALSSAAFGLADILKGVEPEFAIWFVALAIAFTWWLAGTRIRGWQAGMGLFFLGLALIFISVGQLWGPLWAFLRAADYLIGEYLNRTAEVPIDLDTFYLAYNEVYYGVVNLLNVIWVWMLSIIEGPPIFDQAVSSLIWGLVMWSMSAWATWFTRRRSQPVVGILPIGAVLVSGLSYTWSGTGSLIPFLFASLLLLALNNFDLNEVRWKSSRMDYPEDLPGEFAIISLSIVAGLVLIASLLPVISVRDLVEFAKQYTQPSIEEAEPVIQSFGLEQNRVPRGNIDRARSAGLPRSHLMGSGPELAEQIVMSVKISGGLPDDPEQALNLPLYWRSMTYDEYTGFGWRSSEIVMRYYDPGQEAIAKDSPFHRVIQQDFRLARGQTNFLYAAGEILSADDAFKIAWRITPRYTEVHDAPGDFFGASIDQSTYRIQSLIPVVDEDELRAASTEYPAWIEERYLALPESLPSRVGYLARELTADDLTAYDKARTLEQYLRTFEYTLDLEMPPLSRDFVDYFLFSLKKGYCDYYAASMVVMSRSLGIPARLVIGYYRGSYDEINGRYLVSEAEAHSWAEVYFPEIGWVPFEPTAGREGIDRLTQDVSIRADLEQEARLKSLAPWFSQLDWSWSVVLLSLLGGMVLLITGTVALDNWRIYRLRAPEAFQHLYQRLYHHGRRLGILSSKEITPHEFSEALETKISSLAAGSFWQGRLAPAVTEIREFTRAYTVLLFSPATLRMADRKWAIGAWRRLRRRLWLARLIQFAIREN